MSSATRGDILKQIHRAAPGDRARYRIVRVGQPLDVDRADEPVVHLGRVASKGLSDELKGSFYVVLETPTGHAYHLPLDARTAEELRPGDIVTFATRREPAVRPVRPRDCPGRRGSWRKLRARACGRRRAAPAPATAAMAGA